MGRNKDTSLWSWCALPTGVRNRFRYQLLTMTSREFNLPSRLHISQHSTRWSKGLTTYFQSVPVIRDVERTLTRTAVSS